MNKGQTRMVLIVMMITLLSLFGCENKEQKAAKKIVEALEQKYGEEFVLDSIGGGYGTMNSNTFKAMVHPKKDKTLRFSVEITKDLNQVYDKYLNQVVARNAQQPIEEMAQTIWPDARVIVANDTVLTFPEHTDLNMSYVEFLGLYSMNTQLIDVYLNSERYVDNEGNMNQDIEFENYMTFAQLLSEHKYVKSLVSIIYLSPDAYSRFDEAKNSDVIVSYFYRDEEKKEGKLNNVTRVLYEINSDGKIVQDPDKIKNYFDVWKDRRKEFVELKGREKD